MTYERRVVTQTDADPAVVPGTTTNQVVERTEVSPSGGEMLRRVVVLIFGIIQAFIVLRIVLLLLNAREGNDIVAFILNISQIFVAPFIGIFNSDALSGRRIGPRHRRDRGPRRLDHPRVHRPVGRERPPEGAGLNRSLKSRISLRRGPFRPALPAASMAPATPGLGERPTGARVVRRHLLRRGAPASGMQPAGAKRSAWFDPGSSRSDSSGRVGSFAA